MKLKYFSIIMLVLLLTVSGLSAADTDAKEMKSFRLCVPVEIMGLESGQFDSAAVLLKVGDNLFSYEYFEGVDVKHDQLLSLFSGQPEVADNLMDTFIAGHQTIEVILVLNGNKVKYTTFAALQENYSGVSLDNYAGAQLKRSYLFNGAEPVLGESLYNLITGYYTPVVNLWLGRFNSDASGCELLVLNQDAGPQFMPWEKHGQGQAAFDRVMYTSCNNIDPATCTLTFHDVHKTYSPWTMISSRLLFLGCGSNCYCRKSIREKSTVTSKHVYITCTGDYCEYSGITSYEYRYRSEDCPPNTPCPACP
ncbi:MAG: hypothetical protein GY757_49710 [bacterium]|nr:hypothetical protein [bacterium]